MNSRQAVKAAAKKIIELEHMNMMQALDIQEYNRVILDIINGTGPCQWCEEEPECQRECKGHGCQEWWLRFRKPEGAEPVDSSLDDELNAIREQTGGEPGEKGTEEKSPVQRVEE